MQAKCVLVVSGAEAKEAYGMDQLCDGLYAAIEGGIHAVRLLWQHHALEEYWELLLIETCNAFNEENHTAMMWAVRHEWPSCAQFAFI